MEHCNGQASLEDMIDALLAESRTRQTVVTSLESLEGVPVELPSRTAQLNRWFVRLPWREFLVAAPLPGKALAVYMIAWREGMMHATALVKLTSASLRPCAITRSEKVQALACLEEAELITVLRQRGKNPYVTVLTLVGRFGRTSTR